MIPTYLTVRAPPAETGRTDPHGMSSVLDDRQKPCRIVIVFGILSVREGDYELRESGGRVGSRTILRF